MGSKAIAKSGHAFSQSLFLPGYHPLITVALYQGHAMVRPTPFDGNVITRYGQQTIHMLSLCAAAQMQDGLTYWTERATDLIRLWDGHIAQQ